MGGIIAETIRDRQEQVLGHIALKSENQRLREQLGFVTREIHPAERRCEGPGHHPLGAVFYGVDRGSKIKEWVGTGKRTYRLLCPTCYEHHLTGKETKRADR